MDRQTNDYKLVTSQVSVQKGVFLGRPRKAPKNYE
jgi:hypothetical protein